MKRVGRLGGCRQNVRRSGGVEQDVSVFEILRLGSVLQVLLQAVAALVAADGRDGSLVDDYGGILRSHGELSGKCQWNGLGK